MEPTPHPAGIVMVVDDNPDNLRVLSGILRQGGYAVRPAISGELALAALAVSLPDAILLDIRMPDPDGYEVCRRLKAESRTADLPVIFLSALHEVDSKLRAFRCGGVDYIVKPFQPEEVLVRVRTHLELARARRALREQNGELERRVREATGRLRRLTAQALEIQEAERRHIARELHDEIGQTLTAVKIHLQAAERLAGLPEQAPHLREGVRAVEAMLPLVRNLSQSLHPPQLDDIGLVAALRWLLDRQARVGGFRAHFRADEVPGLPRELAIVCFRVAQEALTNVVRHGAARDVWIEFASEGWEVHLSIRDNGTGFDAGEIRRRPASRGHLGLAGMEERVALAGGRFAIDSAPGRGTGIRAWFVVDTQSAGTD